MKPTAVFLMYIGMLVFDAAVLAGTAYLIADRGWSAWWMLVAVCICTGSNPRRIIEAANRTTAQGSGDL